MSGEKPNPLDVAIHQLKTTAKRLDLDEGIHNILKYPKRSLIVSIPVKHHFGETTSCL